MSVTPLRVFRATSAGGGSAVLPLPLPGHTRKPGNVVRLGCAWDLQITLVNEALTGVISFLTRWFRIGYPYQRRDIVWY